MLSAAILESSGFIRSHTSYGADWILVQIMGSICMAPWYVTLLSSLSKLVENVLMFDVSQYLYPYVRSL